MNNLSPHKYKGKIFSPLPVILNIPIFIHISTIKKKRKEKRKKGTRKWHLHETKTTRLREITMSIRSDASSPNTVADSAALSIKQCALRVK